jgi:medium-chain acyl-[acyl-carrier-protein] hydrolase
MFRKGHESRARLFCFPHAGGGASQFLPWRAALPSFVDLCPVQLPGRETRIGDFPYTNMSPLIAEIRDGLQSYLDLPYVLFGHSVGALVAFEVARQLERDNGISPASLIVAACRAPHLSDSLPRISNRQQDSQFLKEVQDRYQAIPSEIINSPDALAFLMPLLRADFTLFESYDYLDAAPLTCPLECFAGRDDDTVSVHELDAWRRQTTRGFDLQWFPGDHFFIHSQRGPVLDSIAKSISRCVQPRNAGARRQ